jgi:dihydrofolate synthase/folylpolyglutamate synthase
MPMSRCCARSALITVTGSGTTLDQIGAEKAGVFRRGQKVVLGSAAMPDSVWRAARKLDCQDLTAERSSAGTSTAMAPPASPGTTAAARARLSIAGPGAVPGGTQYDNAATALAALEEIDSARDPRRPTWILDVAHNPHAARVLAENLRALRASGRTLAVCGILADKDAAGIVEQLRDCIDEWWFVPTEGERGSSAAALQKRVAAHLEGRGHVSASIGEACAAAGAGASAQDRIVVFGSFHTVGPALDWLEHSQLHSPPLPEYTAARS